MTWDFASFLTEFKLYQDDGWMMDDCMQWNHVNDRKDPHLMRGSNPGLLDQQVSA